jgi:hypothetical protein
MAAKSLNNRYVTFKLRRKIVYNKTECSMLVMSDITDTIKINDLQQNSQISSALPATVSYKMRETLANINESIEKLFHNFTNLPPQTILMLNPI